MPGRAIFAVLNALAASAIAAPAYTLIDIGTLGGAGSYGAAVSASGIVAGCADASDGTSHAYTWREGAMRDLGPGCALAVNSAGTAAGRSGSGELVVWRDGAASGLGVQGNVGGIDDAGAVVGTRQAGAATRAFVHRDGVLADLADGPSEASAINARGQVVGSADGHAFLHEDGRLRDLGTLGGNNSIAKGISSSGVVVGLSSNEIGQPAAFAYDQAMRALPAPAYSSAVGINAAGDIVGSAEATRGFLLQGESLTRLDDIPAVAARGWRRLEPTGINDQGWIVGTGENAAGDLRAFLLVPAQPVPVSKPRRIRG